MTSTQRSLLSVAIRVVIAYGVDRIGPRHDQAPELGRVAVDPRPVRHIEQGNGQGDGQRYARAGEEPLAASVIEPPPEEVDARDDSQQEEVPYGRPREESRGFRIPRVEHVAHHLVGDEHLIGIDEVETYGIAYECEGEDALSDDAPEEEHEVIDEEVEREHQDRQTCGDPYAVPSPFDMVEHEPEKRSVERDERKEAECRAYAGKVALFLQELHHLMTVLRNARIVPAHSARSVRLKRIVKGTFTLCVGSA